MAPVVITHTEYAVKIGDRGYVGGFGDSIIDEVPTRSPADGTGQGCVFLTAKSAAETVERIQSIYRNLNAPRDRRHRPRRQPSSPNHAIRLAACRRQRRTSVTTMAELKPFRDKYS